MTKPHKSLSCFSRCRHVTISKFFGDQTPNCAGACDYCKNPKLVRAQLERAAALSTRTGPAQSSEPRGPFGFNRELYEGGKKGYGFERSVDTLLKSLKSLDWDINCIFMSAKQSFNCKCSVDISNDFTEAKWQHFCFSILVVQQGIKIIRMTIKENNQQAWCDATRHEADGLLFSWNRIYLYTAAWQMKTNLVICCYLPLMVVLILSYIITSITLHSELTCFYS